MNIPYSLEENLPGHPEGHQRPRVLEREESVAMRSLRQIYRVRRPWQNSPSLFLSLSLSLFTVAQFPRERSRKYLQGLVYTSALTLLFECSQKGFHPLAILISSASSCTRNWNSVSLERERQTERERSYAVGRMFWKILSYVPADFTILVYFMHLLSVQFFLRTFCRWICLLYASLLSLQMEKRDFRLFFFTLFQ